MRRTKRIVLFAALGTVLVLASSAYWPFPKKRLDPGPVLSLRLLDRNGLLLREVLSDDGGRCRWVRLEDMSPHLLQAVVAAEDRHFFTHKGVNPLSMLRALVQNVRSGRVVSGASTITQQLVRNIYHGRRNLLAKAFEAWMAVRLEHTLGKEEILVQYLNRIPFGNQAFGIEAAARLYLGKPASDLSLAESAFLAGLPRSPSTLNPFRNLTRARERQRRILRQMQRLGFIGFEELSRALAEPLFVRSDKEVFRAPHFCDLVLSSLTANEKERLGAVETTLDAALQAKVEILLGRHLELLRDRGISNGAALVLDNASGDVLALVGSRDFFDSSTDGQFNGALALRQPGSTLKPFTYALALETKRVTAATVIADEDVQFPVENGAFRPKNYDQKYHGAVLLRSALACSYNVPAVRVLQSFGAERLYRKLKDLGFQSLSKDADHYGLGLTLGNGEVTLLELSRAYACLARGGYYKPERTLLARTDKMGRRDVALNSQDTREVFSTPVVFVITHILADQDARIPAFGYHSPLSLSFPAAAKTGTSKDFRDNWTVGYTPRYTAAVWVGNFDGSPMHLVSGITGCGPLFRDIMNLLEHGREPREFVPPSGITWTSVCPQSGLLPGPDCPGRTEEVFVQGTAPQTECRLRHVQDRNARPISILSGFAGEPDGPKILFPSDGDIFKLDPILRRSHQRILLRVRFPESPRVEAVTWWVDGRKLGRAEPPFTLTWNLEPGSHTIRAVGEAQGKRVEIPPVRVSVLS